MTKPDWCTQDVWEATASVPGVGGGHEMQGYIQSVREGASRAILAERERCLMIARMVPTAARGRAMQTDRDRQWVELMEGVAVGIEAGITP